MDNGIVIQTLLAACGALITVIFAKISKDLSSLTKSVQSLNEKMIRVVMKIDSHEKRIVNLERKKRGE